MNSRTMRFPASRQADAGKIESPMFRVMIVEPQRMSRSMLAHYCSQHLGHTIISEMGTGYEIFTLLREQTPDVILLSLNLPDADGLETLEEIRRIVSPEVKILLLVSICTHHIARRVAHVGVDGLVDQHTDNLDAVQVAITAVANGKTYFSSSYWQLREERQRNSRSYDKLLTDQEQRVFEMMARLIDDAAIAADLRISMRTLEGHRLKIMDKLDVDTRAGLLRYARDVGLLSSSSRPFPAGESSAASRR